MTDDRFDRELADRLSAYESRMPDADPPAADAPLGGPPRWPLIGFGALAAVAAVLLLAVLIRGSADKNIGDASSSPIPSPSAGAPSEPAPTITSGPLESGGPTPTPELTPSPPDPTVDLRWTETASFASPGTATTVSAIVRSEGGLVAVGVAYEGPLPIFGPIPPHEGRVWLSTDAVTWNDVTPESAFVNAELRHLLITSDRRIVAHGWVEDEGSALGRRPAAWESIAGRSWEEIESGFPDQAWPMSIAQGARGYLALIVEPEAPTLAVWWSANGRSWERVRELGAEGGYWVGAGDEGFVVAGYQGAAQEPVAIASGDGRQWVEAGTPPGIAAGVAPRSGDWLVVSREAQVVNGEPSTARVWSSADGLVWEQSGAFPLGSRTANEAPCTEWPTSLHAAGPWLIAGTVVSYPCSEGGVQTQGAQLISLDGVDWSELPFAPASEEVGLGTRISGAMEVDGRLVLVGDQDRVATFWIGEQP